MDKLKKPDDLLPVISSLRHDLKMEKSKSEEFEKQIVLLKGPLIKQNEDRQAKITSLEQEINDYKDIKTWADHNYKESKQILDKYKARIDELEK